MAEKRPSLNVLSGPLSGQKFVLEDAVWKVIDNKSANGTLVALSLNCHPRGPWSGDDPCGRCIIV